MDISLKSQFFAICLSVFFGFILGMLYHCINFFENIFLLSSFEINCKKLSKFKVNCSENNWTKIALIICDLFYFVIITPISAIFIFGVNGGIVRAYLFIGCFIGLILYFFTIGKIFKIIVNYLSILFHATVLRLMIEIKNKLKRMVEKRNSKNNKKTKRKLNIVWVNRNQGWISALYLFYCILQSPFLQLPRTKDSQSTHWDTVGLLSCVPIFTVSKTQ